MDRPAMQSVVSSLRPDGDISIGREVWRSYAAMLRHNSALLREEVSLNRWHAWQNMLYLKFLLGEAAACMPPQAGTAPSSPTTSHAAPN